MSINITFRANIPSMCDGILSCYLLQHCASNLYGPTSLDIGICELRNRNQTFYEIGTLSTGSKNRDLKPLFINLLISAYMQTEFTFYV